MVKIRPSERPGSVVVVVHVKQIIQVEKGSPPSKAPLGLGNERRPMVSLFGGGVICESVPLSRHEKIVTGHVLNSESAPQNCGLLCLAYLYTGRYVRTLLL